MTTTATANLTQTQQSAFTATAIARNAEIEDLVHRKVEYSYFPPPRGGVLLLGDKAVYTTGVYWIIYDTVILEGADLQDADFLSREFKQAVKKVLVTTWLLPNHLGEAQEIRIIMGYVTNDNREIAPATGVNEADATMEEVQQIVTSHRAEQWQLWVDYSMQPAPDGKTRPTLGRDVLLTIFENVPNDEMRAFMQSPDHDLPTGDFAVTLDFIPRTREAFY